MEYISEEELNDLLKDTEFSNDDPPIVALGNGIYKVQVGNNAIITNEYGVRELGIAMNVVLEKLKKH